MARCRLPDPAWPPRSRARSGGGVDKLVHRPESPHPRRRYPVTVPAHAFWWLRWQLPFCSDRPLRCRRRQRALNCDSAGLFAAVADLPMNRLPAGSRFLLPVAAIPCQALLHSQGMRGKKGKRLVCAARFALIPPALPAKHRFGFGLRIQFAAGVSSQPKMRNPDPCLDRGIGDRAWR